LGQESRSGRLCWHTNERERETYPVGTADHRRGSGASRGRWRRAMLLRRNSSPEENATTAATLDGERMGRSRAACWPPHALGLLICLGHPVCLPSSMVAGAERNLSWSPPAVGCITPQPGARAHVPPPPGPLHPYAAPPVSLSPCCGMPPMTDGMPRAPRLEADGEAVGRQAPTWRTRWRGRGPLPR
jgi:hypothetical protein